MDELAKLTEREINGLRADLLHNAHSLRHGIPIEPKDINALCDMALAALDGVRVPEFTFNEVLEYLEAREDVADGADGPKPNTEMRLATGLRECLATASSPIAAVPIAFAWLKDGEIRVRVGWRDFTLVDAREYLVGKENRREVILALDYVERVLSHA